MLKVQLPRSKMKISRELHLLARCSRRERAASAMAPIRLPSQLGGNEINNDGSAEQHKWEQ